MPGPMMGDTPSGVVARRMWPSSVASLDSTLYRAMMRGQLLHPPGAAPGFDGVGSIRHRTQKAVVGGGTFLVELGAGAGAVG